METEFLDQIPRKLQESEINYQINAFWHSSCSFWLGDILNGFKVVCDSAIYEEGIIWLANQASKHYPDSDFAKWWNQRNK